MTTCPACGHDSDRCWRCSECGHDLVGVDDDDDDGSASAAALVPDGGERIDPSGGQATHPRAGRFGRPREARDAARERQARREVEAQQREGQATDQGGCEHVLGRSRLPCPRYWLTGGDE